MNRNVSSLLVECGAQIQSSTFFPGPKVSSNSTFCLGYELSCWQSRMVTGGQSY